MKAANQFQIKIKFDIGLDSAYLDGTQTWADTLRVAGEKGELCLIYIFKVATVTIT